MFAGRNGGKLARSTRLVQVRAGTADSEGDPKNRGEGFWPARREKKSRAPMQRDRAGHRMAKWSAAFLRLEISRF